MNNQTHLHDDDHITNLVNDVSEGINGAGTAFSDQEDVIEESTLKQSIRYVLWGLISVVVNIGTFSLLYQVGHLNYQVAFWIDREIVFRHKSRTVVPEMMAFYGTRVFTYFVEAFTLWVGISVLTANGTASKVVGQFLAIVFNFIFSKFFIFKNRPQH